MFKPQVLGLLLAVSNRKASSIGSIRRMQTLVDGQWLADRLEQKSSGDRLRVVHASWSNCNDYARAHIPGAVCFDGEQCRDTKSPYKNMLPKPEEFAKYVGEKLGIDNETDVVVYDPSETVGVMLATRVWYMFRVFGHDRVGVLNGGMREWRAKNRPITSEETRVSPKKFTPHFRPELLLTYEQVLDRVAKRNETQLLDARGSQSFEGDPSSKEKTGHIRNALNLPHLDLLDNESGLVRDEATLKKLFDDAGVNFSRPLAVSCGTGMTATALAFGAHLLGKETPVYDGSWFEWSRRAPDEYISKKE